MMAFARRIPILSYPILLLPFTGLCLSLSRQGRSYSGCSDRKLVINSHVEYGSALASLRASLERYGFPLSSAVVFRGGAPADTEPYMRNGMYFVDVHVNSYDMNAFYGLSKYHDDPAVCATLYFYIHDTTSVGPCFADVFRQLTVAPDEVIIAGESYYSNQCVIGAGVVQKFGDSFNWNIAKPAGFQIEAGGCIRGPYGQQACAAKHYAQHVRVIAAREDLPQKDVYHTGKPRMVRYYRDWDLYKYFLYQPYPNNPVKDLNFGEHNQTQTQSPLWAPQCGRIPKAVLA